MQCCMSVNYLMFPRENWFDTDNQLRVTSTDSVAKSNLLKVGQATFHFAKKVPALAFAYIPKLSKIVRFLLWLVGRWQQQGRLGIEMSSLFVCLFVLFLSKQQKTRPKEKSGNRSDFPPLVKKETHQSGIQLCFCAFGRHTKQNRYQVASC